MHVPQWLALTIAGAVIMFGFFRIYLAVAGPSDDERASARRGLYAMSRRQHGLVGVLFLLVAGALVATAFGWNPVGRKVAPAPAPAGPRAPRAPAPPAPPAGSGAIIVE